MQLVIDTNILLAAFAKDSVARKLIIDSELHFCAPGILSKEVQNHLFYDEKFRKKVKLDEESIRKLLTLLIMKIEIVDAKEYSPFLKEADSLISHKNDVPFLALALARNISILSHDSHFTKQKKVRIFNITEVMGYRDTE